MVEPIVKRIDNHTVDDDIVIVGIAGGSGSGKTTLARAIFESLGKEENITYISHDSYYKDISHLTMSEREKENFDHPDSLDTALLIEHLAALKRKEQVFIPTYDYATHSRLKGHQALPSRRVILLEGILIFVDPALYEQIDVKIFVDTEDDIRLIRRIQRDTMERGRTLKSVITQYIKTVRPMHLQFVEPSKRNADIIVPVGLNSVALDLVVSKLKAVIEK
jgi:uridine kinase